MIAQTISQKLEGRHYEAFRSFALRSGAVTSRDNLKRLIETLPEYRSLLNIHEGTPEAGPGAEIPELQKSSVNTESITKAEICQDNSGGEAA